MFFRDQSIRLAALLCLPLVPTAWAQVGSRITGSVRDSSGGHVISAKVTLVDVNRGGSLNSTTNETGRFTFSNLDVGEYILKAEMVGFKQAVTPSLRLELNQVLE